MIPNADFSPRGKLIFRAAFLGAIMVGYVLILQIGEAPYLRGFPNWQLVLPNFWLIATSLYAAKRFGMSPQVFGGGRRTKTGAVIYWVGVVLVLAFAFFWPFGEGLSARPLLNGMAERICLIWLVPFAEELCYRGLLLDHFLGSLKSKVVAVLITSLIFGLAHLPQDFWVAVTMFALSLVLCAVVLVCGTLLFAIALHAGWNALVQLSRASSSWERGLIVVVFCTLAVVVFFLGRSASAKRKVMN